MSLPAAEIPILIIAQDPLIYNTVAASAFFFWEYCITFDEEVDLIWRWNLSLVSIMFHVIRYGTFGIRILELLFYANISGLIQPTVARCTAWIWIEVIVGQVMFICLGILFLLRVFAFYGKSKTLLAGLIVLFVLENAAEITIIVLTVPKMRAIPNPLPTNLHVSACVIVELPVLFAKFWLPALLFQSILFFLVLAKFVQTKRQAGADSPHLLSIFIRDGTWAFTLGFAVLLWGVLAYELEIGKGDVALTWIYSILSFCATRLVLNLRSAARRRCEATYDTGLNIKFRGDQHFEMSTKDLWGTSIVNDSVTVTGSDIPITT